MAVTRIDTQDIRDLTILTQDIADSQVTPGKAYLSASSVWTFQGGLSGSIQQTSAGLSYIAGGTGITVTSASNGQITITTDAAGATAAKYLVLDLDSNLSNERVFSPGLGLTGSDTGPNGTFTIAVRDSIVATLTGSHFSGNIRVNGTGSFYNGLSGSLTQLTNGTSYLVAGTNISITSQSNGQVTINAADALSGLVSFDDFVFGEVPAGTINGSNAIFTSLQVYKNGLRMLSGSSNDYILSGTVEVGVDKLIVFQANSIPTTNSSIQIDYLLAP